MKIYIVFVVSGPGIAIFLVAFALAGIGIGCAETVEHAAVAAFAPSEIRGSAFGLLYTVASPAVAFTHLAAWMLIALGAQLGRPQPGKLYST